MSWLWKKKGYKPSYTHAFRCGGTSGGTKGVDEGGKPSPETIDLSSEGETRKRRLKSLGERDSEATPDKASRHKGQKKEKISKEGETDKCWMMR
ncbi:hypothetical protein L1987_48304 [Smallanthus sonchifolius]|uniref:Uncharacterized protein n=1 Tax=Smallanthus sonchifolius TaxID=185202 RepID=A0ACB9FT82_9ASTR|nr:hypothetical protein L1987_48304 [Smallanthus sonchifolius]